MKMEKYLVVSILTLGIGTVTADTYRCKSEDGKTVYQQIPCSIGAQKTINDSETRYKEEQKKVKAEAEKQAKEKLSKHKSYLSVCLESKSCTADDYPWLLKGKLQTFVVDNLGAPASVQNIGGREIHYFNVPTTDGRKTAKLQVTYIRSDMTDVANGTVYGATVVDSVNIY